MYVRGEKAKNYCRRKQRERNRKQHLNNDFKHSKERFFFSNRASKDQFLKRKNAYTTSASSRESEIYWGPLDLNFLNFLIRKKQRERTRKQHLNNNFKHSKLRKITYTTSTSSGELKIDWETLDLENLDVVEKLLENLLEQLEPRIRRYERLRHEEPDRLSFYEALIGGCAMTGLRGGSSEIKEVIEICKKVKKEAGTPEKKLIRAKKTDPNFYEFTQGYMHNNKWVDMSQPKLCKKTAYDENYNQKAILFGVEQIRGEDGTHDIPVELRGITIRQMRAIDAIVKRYAQEERIVNRDGKVLTYEEVKFYEINSYIIMPFTSDTKKSLVEVLMSTAGTQPPLWFMSHWWGEYYCCTMNCVEQFMKDFELPDSESLKETYGLNGGGITIDTPIWCCAFANRQHDLTDITIDPIKSGCARAMHIAEFRTLSILDPKSVVFSRIWCTFELYLTLVLVEEENKRKKVDGNWAVYTSHHHIHNDEERKAVGLISRGMASSDDGVVERAVSREKHFPHDRIIAALKMDIEKANASKNSDKIHILNYIANPDTTDFEESPVVNHPMYNKLNEMVRGAFLCSIPVLRHALHNGDNDWNQALYAMNNSIKRNVMSFDFNSGWENLTKEKAAELIRHLPLTIEGLEIINAPYGAEFINAIAEYVGVAKNLKRLYLYETFAGGSTGGRDCGINLANAISNHSKIEHLELLYTDLMGRRNASDWEMALRTNNSLTKMECCGIANNQKYKADSSTYNENESTVGLYNYKKLPHLYCNNPYHYWNYGMFSDAVLMQEQENRLKTATNAITVIFTDMTGKMYKCNKNGDKWSLRKLELV